MHKEEAKTGRRSKLPRGPVGSDEESRRGESAPYSKRKENRIKQGAQKASLLGETSTNNITKAGGKNQGTRRKESYEGERILCSHEGSHGGWSN